MRMAGLYRSTPIYRVPARLEKVVPELARRAGFVSRRARSPGRASLERLLRLQTDVVDHERGLVGAVLYTLEVDLHGLALVRADVEALLRVAGVVVDVRVRRQRRQHGARAVEQLHGQRIVLRRRGRLGGIDVQPERER